MHLFLLILLHRSLVCRQNKYARKIHCLGKQLTVSYTVKRKNKESPRKYKQQRKNKTAVSVRITHFGNNIDWNRIKKQKAQRKKKRIKEYLKFFHAIPSPKKMCYQNRCCPYRRIYNRDMGIAQCICLTNAKPAIKTEERVTRKQNSVKLSLFCFI